MSTTRRTFTREFKIAAVKRLQAGQPARRLARELEVNPNQLHAWRRDYETRPNSAFSGEGRRRSEESQFAELESKIGKQAMEIDFLKTACGGSKSCGWNRPRLPHRALPPYP